MAVTLKDMAGGAGGGQGGVGQQQQRQAPTVDGGSDDDQLPAGMDVKKVWQENRKLSRLLAKNQGELTGLRSEFEPLKGIGKKFDSLRSLFAGETGDEKQDEGSPKLSVYERARQMHQRAIDADPESTGIPLTVDIAHDAHEAFKLVQDQAKIIKELQEQIKTGRTPMASAEGAAYVKLDDKLRDKVEELFEDAGIADQNYKDFERLAIEMMQQKRGDEKLGRRWWQKFVSSDSAMDAFVQEVIARKMPRAYVRRGSESIAEDYTLEEAMRDMEKVPTMAQGLDRRKLAEKSRRRMIQETFGSQIDMGGRR